LEQLEHKTPHIGKIKGGATFLLLQNEGIKLRKHLIERTLCPCGAFHLIGARLGVCLKIGRQCLEK